MKYILSAFLTITLLFPTFYAAAESPPSAIKSPLLPIDEIIQTPIKQTRIVGGELTKEGDWPWMTALVFTYNNFITSLNISGNTYNSAYLSYSPTGQASALMVDCGIGDTQCDLARGKICLLARGEIDFSVKAENCEAGGGIGAIIYNNVVGELAFTLGEDFAGTIPVIAISQTDGATLLANIDNVATISFESEIIDQIANCGATFIGTKWVLTAAHCVEDSDINFLKVNVGEYDLRNGARNAKSIKNIYIHPEYNEGTDINNDIALLELVETVDQPAVALLGYDESRSLALANSAATVIGWGNTVAYGPNDISPPNSQPDKLLQVELSLLTNEQCKNKLVQAYKETDNVTFSTEQVGITESMICAHFNGGGKGSCQGDSGGPLLVNTNQGWQQIGIVSYGVGCANESFPDVFTRVGNFTAWINSITEGIAIETNYSFPITPQFKAQSKLLTITNNSGLTANLTFDLVTNNIGDSSFSITTDNCAILMPEETCQIEVGFDAKTTGQQSAQVIIKSSNGNIATSEAYIVAHAVPENLSINNQLSNDSNEFRWFSGGDQPWLIDNTEAAIMSGNITDGQQSSVILTFTGQGSLSFDWAVSSEENPDASEPPFDALYLIVDGEQIEFISGEIAYKKVEISNLSAGEHQITWLYKKDPATSEGKDKGYIKNVVFTATSGSGTDTSPSKPVISTNSDKPASKSSGGSLHISVLILALVYLRRRKILSQ